MWKIVVFFQKEKDANRKKIKFFQCDLLYHTVRKWEWTLPILWGENFSPVSDKSLRDELSAVRLRPSPTEQLSSKLVLPKVPFTTSLFTPAPPPTMLPVNKPGRITPFCFSSSAVNSNRRPGNIQKKRKNPDSVKKKDDFFRNVQQMAYLHSTRYFSISCTSAILSLRSLTKRVRSCWLGAIKTIRTFLSPPKLAEVRRMPWG